MSHLLYLALLGGCLLGTAPLELGLRTGVYARWRRLALALVPTLALFATWDVYAIGRGLWTYDGHWITGLRLPGDLPIEELLFFFVIPICSVLTLEAVRRCRPTWSIGDEP